MIALWSTVIAALIAAVLAPWVKDRIDSARDAETQSATAKASLERITEARVERLFGEYDTLRKAYRSDLEDARSQIREAHARITLLEAEVAEWRAGVRGVEGLWVAVPASVMKWIRENAPVGLPPAPFPGEPTHLGDGGE